MSNPKYTQEYVQHICDKMVAMREKEPHAKGKDSRDIILSVQQACYLMEILRTNIVLLKDLDAIENTFVAIDFLVEQVENYNDEAEVELH